MAVRPAQLEDLNACLKIDPSYQTDYVWQMEQREEMGGVAVRFYPTRLPRAMRVVYPRSRDDLLTHWEEEACVLVAEEGERVVGYLDASVQTWNDVGWIEHLAVRRRNRRRGVGTQLLGAAVQWARAQELGRLMVAVQTKNYPAICFYQKYGFAFCGFNDRYFTNHDIAVFFEYGLR